MCASAKENVRHARRRRPGEPILFLVFAHRYSSFRFFFKKCKSQKKWLESWPSMLKSAQTRAKRRWEEGKPTRKAAHQVERNVWFSSTVEHFEGIIRNARKKGILHGTTLWSLAALMWVPVPATLFDLHTDIWLQIFFFVDPCRKNIGASDQIFDVCTQTRRFQFFSFSKKIAHRKPSTKPDNVNNTNTMTQNICRCFFKGLCCLTVSISSCVACLRFLSRTSASTH